MTCKHGCCRTALGVCYTNHKCPCHPVPIEQWAGVGVIEAPNRLPWRDPTANTAIHNADRR